jgi:hypothetical protein
VNKTILSAVLIVRYDYGKSARSGIDEARDLLEVLDEMGDDSPG